METIAEEARRRGLAVGLVTTSSITDATPAAFYAHTDDRDMHEVIARQAVRSGFDLLAGGGRAYFLSRAAGGLRADDVDLVAKIRALGVAVTATLEAARDVPRGRPVALLYAEEAPPPAGPSRPPLEDLVDLALGRLSSDPDGFFLMVEGAQIDWAEHGNNAQALVSELADFDRAVARARRFAASHAQIVVVVVADHDTASPGLVTRKGSDSQLEVRFLTGGHSALLVPLLVNGASASSWTRSSHLTDLGQSMREWLLGTAR